VALADPAAAVELAALIDRLGITDIGGFEPDLTPLRPLVTRWLEQTPCTAVTLPRGFHWGAPAPDTRPATRDDLNQVTNLMWRYAPQAFANRWLLRRRVTRAIDDLVLVIEDGDPKRIVGVAARDSITTKYHCWAQIAVDPAYRRRSHSWSLIAAIMDSGHTADVGLIGFVSATNPMPIPEDAMYPQTWFNVALSPPSRFHGEAALRVVLDVLLQLGAPAQGASEKAIRAPGASDGLITDRRTQHWWSRSNSEFDEN
jgi:N-acetylglutamate synthase-like GNAT family acetyltransferase